MQSLQRLPRNQPARRRGLTEPAHAGPVVPEDACALIEDLASSQRAVVDCAHQLMLARDLADALARGADAAVGSALDEQGDQDAIDRAVASVKAAADAKENETRVLERWAGHLERAEELVSAASRVTAQQL